MQIILQQDVDKLGTRGQVLEVKEGYARNYLLPRKLALEASPTNMKRLEKMRKYLTVGKIAPPRKPVTAGTKSKTTSPATPPSPF